MFFGESVLLGLAGFVGSSSVVMGSAGMASGSSSMGISAADVSEFMGDVLRHSVDSLVSSSSMVLSEVTLGDVVHAVLSGVEFVVSVSNHVSFSSMVSLGLLSGTVSFEGASGSSAVHSHLFDVTVFLVSVLLVVSLVNNLLLVLFAVFLVSVLLVVSLVNNLLLVLFGYSFLSNLIGSFDGVLLDVFHESFLKFRLLFESLVSLLSLSLGGFFVTHLAESVSKLEVGSSLFAQVLKSFFGMVDGLLHLLFGKSLMDFLHVVSMLFGVVRNLLLVLFSLRVLLSDNLLGFFWRSSWQISWRSS